ncbi:unnamed protein product [Mytilus coruscus]|uniref:Uncharacterized protein n=1 Tax=Mytilus coruscus TaxID=42192 RepID=A0A6J8CRW9_MYTCO|nr:unnamed protein product [Mytilus coruscus]
MEGPWNCQPCRNGHPFPMRKADTCLDFLYKYCGKDIEYFHSIGVMQLTLIVTSATSWTFCPYVIFTLVMCETQNRRISQNQKLQRQRPNEKVYREETNVSISVSGLEDKELSAFTCSTESESKQQLNKLKASHRISLKEIAVLKCENSKLDTAMKENVMLRNSLDELNLKRLKHVRLIQTTKRELTEQSCRTENFEIEIVRLKEENLSLTNTRYRLTMDLKSKEMQDYHVIKKLKDEIQRLKIQNSNDIREHQDLLHELSIAENQIESLRTNYSHNPHQRQRRGGYPRR